MEKLQSLVKVLGLQKEVIFTGMVPPEEVPLYYSLANIFVTASTSESQGLTYIEALASGLPVVCKYDEVVEGLIVNGVNGYMYKNKEDFVKCINLLFYANEDIDELRNKAKVSVERFSLNVFATNIERLYLNHVQ